ncbi:hypothetical protein MAR_037189 [Mya arenaria]|uniref:Uncharacterized protein n=1 Tax=Mya arenaria TaxID=6604 RepID=A0ABY7FN84_MYAAR|nr:hypothetical protein MAR_037189 [Mya arenaria]
MATREGGENDLEEKKVEPVGTYHLSVPNPLTRTVSLNDTKAYQKIKQQDKDYMPMSNSETDLRRYFLSPKGIRRSVSVNDYTNEIIRCPLGVKFNLSDDEVFEFPHTRSPISLKVREKELSFSRRSSNRGPRKSVVGPNKSPILQARCPSPHFYAMYLGVPGRFPEIADDGSAVPRHRRASLQLWATNSFENLSLSHDDSVLQTRNRGRSKLRKNKCLSWLGSSPHDSPRNLSPSTHGNFQFQNVRSLRQFE